MASEPIPAATILLLRDGPGALEVLMIERHPNTAFASGALVFPGGKLAAEDADAGWTGHVDGRFDTPERALRIAAIREAFEETGLLLARPREARGDGAALAGADRAAPLEPFREPVNAGEASFLKLIADAQLVLALDALVYFAHWITPERLPKRFDTHFYVAIAPPEQSELCDGGEAVEACWMTPKAALAAEAERRRRVMFPTRMNLELLAGAGSASEAMARAAARPVVTVLPKVELEDGAPMLVIPPDAGYSLSRAPFDPARD
ncbi:MAG: NUDIX domain-containing protein [Hyphomonadaceae bacterium]|nr:NUDIX domain-containing protein [Hyphomonadaceae bacterium]